jgi:hypothetical protein
VGVEDVAGVVLLGGGGGAFGFDAGGLGAGVEAVAELDVVGDFGLDAGGLGAGVEAVAELDVVGAFGLDAGGLGAGVEAVAELDVVGVAALAGVDADGVVRLDEPPQPAHARRPTARVNVESLDGERSNA